MASTQTANQANQSTLTSEEITSAAAPKLEPEKTLLQWRAAERPFKKRDKQFWTTVVVIAAIFGLILFLVEGAMPVILIISLIFLYYVLSTVEPEEIGYEITTKGIKIADKTTDWQNVTNFWFGRRLNTDLFIFGVIGLPGRLELVINPKDKEKIRKVVSEYVPEEETPPSSLDRAANWVSEKLPGNTQ